MKQTTEEDGLLFDEAVQSDPEKSLNNKEEKPAHYFHIPRVNTLANYETLKEGCAA